MAYPKREYRGSLLYQEIISKEQEEQEEFLPVIGCLGLLLCLLLGTVFLGFILSI